MLSVIVIFFLCFIISYIFLIVRKKDNQENVLDIALSSFLISIILSVISGLLISESINTVWNLESREVIQETDQYRIIKEEYNLLPKNKRLNPPNLIFFFLKNGKNKVDIIHEYDTKDSTIILRMTTVEDEIEFESEKHQIPRVK